MNPPNRPLREAVRPAPPAPPESPAGRPARRTGTLSLRARITAVAVAGVLLAGIAVVYTVGAARRAEPADPVSAFGIGHGQLYFRSTGAGSGRIAHLPAPASGAAPAAKGRASGPHRTTGGPRCERFYAAADTALCLQRRPGIPPTSYAVVLDRTLHEKRRIALTGIPNRARVSASGRMLSWTMFATGDSYATTSFSTRTSLLDTRTGYLIKNMEEIPLTLDGRRYHSPDVNYWGVSFARDDNTFYATVSTRGSTYLVQGDLRKWTAHTLRENVECPSLSPDNTRLAFKKRVRDGARAPWRLYVLDLRTHRERPLAETRSVDDQAAWLDNGTLAYALPGKESGSSDIWTVPADGHGSPALRVPDASSPARVP
ncbi:TolB family protein [Streptomyces sp. NPDC048644]|uniref:TolB family protein n=1 Tax=Streptomyces sp. NPDC048644 TaxID=3365582 RepID=UPI003722E1FA